MGAGSDERIITNLQDSGCGEEQIIRFMKCYGSDDFKAGSKILAAHRKYLLEQLHMTQKQIECLDYLAYQIQKNETKRIIQ